MEESAMCHSWDWESREEQKRQEAAEAQRKRADVIDRLLVEAEKKAQDARAEKVKEHAKARL